MKLFEAAATVLENREVKPGYFRLALSCDDIACAAGPGQFVMVSSGQSFSPLLRRPFSVHDVVEAEDGKRVLVLLYMVVGQGTRSLSLLAPGACIQVLGPLGRGFTPNPDAEECLLAAGGIGVAPMAFLARCLAQEVSARTCKVLLGARTEKDILCQDVFSRLGLEVLIATEDGSLGQKGLVTDLLEKALSRDCRRQVFSCGPMPMLKAVAALAASRSIPCQVSVEASMACGMGACLGCALPKKEGEEKHLHACMDGPVLEASLLFS